MPVSPHYNRQSIIQMQWNRQSARCKHAPKTCNYLGENVLTHRQITICLYPLPQKLFMQGLNFAFICVLFSSFIFVHSIASHDATSCHLYGISRGRAWCHHRMTLSGSYWLGFVLKLTEGGKLAWFHDASCSLAPRLHTDSTARMMGMPIRTRKPFIVTYLQPVRLHSLQFYCVH